MKNLLVLVFGLLLTFVTGKSFAGVGSSGGGNVIVCKSNKDAELLDYYEARVIRGLKIDLGDASLNYLDKVRYVLNRLKKIDPNRAEEYFEDLDDFEKSSRIIDNFELTPVDDSLISGLPSGCELKQAAVQHPPEFPNDPYYIISGNLWKLLSENGKAGLVLHEIIYREMLHNNAKDSKGARYYNGIISSLNYNYATLTEYPEILSSVQLSFQDSVDKVCYRSKNSDHDDDKRVDLFGFQTWDRKIGENSARWIDDDEKTLVDFICADEKDNTNQPNDAERFADTETQCVDSQNKFNMTVTRDWKLHEREFEGYYNTLSVHITDSSGKSLENFICE